MLTIQNKRLARTIHLKAHILGHNNENGQTDNLTSGTNGMTKDGAPFWPSPSQEIGWKSRNEMKRKETKRKSLKKKKNTEMTDAHTFAPHRNHLKNLERKCSRDRRREEKRKRIG